MQHAAVKADDLHAAVKTDNVPLIFDLLAAGVDPNSLGDQGIPPIFLCESVGATDALLRAGANIEYELGDSFGNSGTALHVAVECERAEVSTAYPQAPLRLSQKPPKTAPCFGSPLIAG